MYLPCWICCASPKDEIKICLQLQLPDTVESESVVFSKCSGGGKLAYFAACLVNSS